MAKTPMYYYKRRRLQSKNKNLTENSNNGEEDRLTSLPDTLLIEILSHLPLKSAAATSVLSHRWRHLWNELPHLFFDGDNPPWKLSRRPSTINSHNRDQTFIKFKDIVHHILCQMELPAIKNGIVSLPNLKKHQLGAISWDDYKKIWAFINSCPLLEVVSLEVLFCNSGVVNISSPKLKSLIINRIVSEGVEFVIDTPMLEYLVLDGFLGYYSFVKYPTKLIKAELCVWNFMHRRRDIFGQSRNIFVQRISGVESISLKYALRFFEALDYLDVDVDVGSIFCNVTHLILTTPSVNDIDNNFQVPNTIPLCLFRKLKRLLMSKMTGNSGELKWLKYLLSKSNVLEQLYISSRPEFSDGDDDDDDDNEVKKRNQLWWEYKIHQTH
ncbi:putative F-box/FBD/LRR-repeat protein At3g49030 [Chenopodium quinoa]|uniref:putative F-box/FBD/LRR-repeat protein At3g49030 n=1 Tax=Chenopodium quinoa TaxID=63459 RepID=UPI000B78926D|nr:putative F-box/FBD/LRR-repeat protein At3g49030 [Chenopodium quinoa]